MTPKFSTTRQLQGGLLALAALCSLNSLAARPFATEDAGVLDARDCELEGVHEQARVPGDAGARAQTLQGACGIAVRTQLGLGVQTLRTGGVRERGLSASGKTALVVGGDGQPSLALAYGGDWQRRGSGSGSGSGSGYQLTGIAVSLVASVPAGAWGTLHANLGRQQDRPGKINRTTWAVALEKGVTEHLHLGVESYSDNRDPTWVAAGLRWSASSVLSFNASAARQTGTPRATAYSVGGKIDF